VRKGEEFLVSYGRGFWSAPRRAGGQDEDFPPQKRFRATKGSADRARQSKEAAAEKTRAAEERTRAAMGSKDKPIVLATAARRYHINAMGRAPSVPESTLELAADTEPGTWILHEQYWRCRCSASLGFVRLERAAGCEACGEPRPIRSQEQRERAARARAAQELQAAEESARRARLVRTQGSLLLARQVAPTWSGAAGAGQAAPAAGAQAAPASNVPWGPSGLRRPMTGSALPPSLLYTGKPTAQTRAPAARARAPARPAVAPLLQTALGQGSTGPLSERPDFARATVLGPGARPDDPNWNNWNQVFEREATEEEQARIRQQEQRARQQAAAAASAQESDGATWGAECVTTLPPEVAERLAREEADRLAREEAAPRPFTQRDLRAEEEYLARTETSRYLTRADHARMYGAAGQYHNPNVEHDEYEESMAASARRNAVTDKMVEAARARREQQRADDAEAARHQAGPARAEDDDDELIIDPPTVLVNPGHAARLARMQEWATQPEDRGARLVKRKDEYEYKEGEARKGWNNAPPACGCRGTAGKTVGTDEEHFKVYRVDSQKQGYCIRNTCECCAPVNKGRGGQWCSCKAGADGLCRRCWADFFIGPSSWYPSQYWGPHRQY
jgi:hypothetical protein